MDITFDLKKLCKKEKMLLNNFPTCTKHCPVVSIHKTKLEDAEKEVNRLNRENLKMQDGLKAFSCNVSESERQESKKQGQAIKTHAEIIDRLKTALNKARADNDLLRKNIVEISNAKNSCAKKRKHKYNAIATVIHGHKFPSKREGRRYLQLFYEKKAGLIKDFWLQPKFVLTSGKEKVTYIADFKVLHLDNKIVIEDVKGKKTAVYNLKKKLMKNCYGIDIKEV